LELQEKYEIHAILFMSEISEWGFLIHAGFPQNIFGTGLKQFHHSADISGSSVVGTGL